MKVSVRLWCGLDDEKEARLESEINDVIFTEIFDKVEKVYEDAPTYLWIEKKLTVKKLK